MRAQVVSWIAAAAVVVGLSGCQSSRKELEPLTLKLAVNDIYCKDTACECVHYVAGRTYADTLELLKRDENVTLRLDYYIEPYQLEEAILSGDYDGVISKPWIALMLEKKAGADFESVADVIDPNGNRWLTGIVVTRADSKFKTLEDLQGGSVVIGDADGYEKHYAAKRLFKERGVAFKRVESTASCIENLGMLLDEKVDAAVVSDYALTADCAVDFAKPEDFRILATTEKIPLTSVIVDERKVSRDQIKQLRAALLAVSGTAAPESMLSTGFDVPVDWEPAEAE